MLHQRLSFFSVTGILLLGLSAVGFGVSRWQPVAVLGERTQMSFPALVSEAGGSKLVAGVVPHHEVGLSLADDWWRLAAKTGATKVLIIGPQHHPNPAPIVASGNFPTLTGVYRDDQLLALDHAFTISWL